MRAEARDEWTYVVTDVELDGPWPGVSSMRSFASVAVTVDGPAHGRFEAVLEPLPGTAPEAKTMAWFDTLPAEWFGDVCVSAVRGLVCWWAVLGLNQ